MLSYKSGNINLRKITDGTENSDNFRFSENTTYALGGTAERVYYPKNLVQARAVYDKIKEQGRKFAIIGNGSNILASDNPFDGDVVSTVKMRGIINYGEGKIFCLSGTSVGELLRYCLKRQLGGLEYLCGIPATVGGLAYMNAGAAGKYVCANIDKVFIYNGKNVVLDNKRCNFSYKHSTMCDINCIILGVFFNLERSSEKEIIDGYRYYSGRRANLPKGKSCGCVFKNYNGISAGKIIDACGLKGFSVGGARVSERHANFIVNEGDSSDDVKKLISAVKRKVYEISGILLEEEVVYIGEFNDFNC